MEKFITVVTTKHNDQFQWNECKIRMNLAAQDLATVCSFPADQEKVETLLVKAEQLQVGVT